MLSIYSTRSRKLSGVPLSIERIIEEESSQVLTYDPASDHSVGDRETYG